MCVGTTGRLTDVARSWSHSFFQNGRRSRMVRRPMDGARDMVRAGLVQMHTAPVRLDGWQGSGRGADMGDVLLQDSGIGAARRRHRSRRERRRGAAHLRRGLAADGRTIDGRCRGGGLDATPVVCADTRRQQCIGFGWRRVRAMSVKIVAKRCSVEGELLEARTGAGGGTGTAAQAVYKLRTTTVSNRGRRPTVERTTAHTPIHEAQPFWAASPSGFPLRRASTRARRLLLRPNGSEGCVALRPTTHYASHPIGQHTSPAPAAIFGLIAVSRGPRSRPPGVMCLHNGEPAAAGDPCGEASPGRRCWPRPERRVAI